MEAIEALREKGADEADARRDTLLPDSPRGGMLLAAEPLAANDTIKRVVDVALSLALLVLLAPLMLAIALLIKIDSRGTVFFHQSRLGLGVTQFTMLKFRTMQDGCSTDLHREFIDELAKSGTAGTELKKLTDDPRVTRVGKVLRRLSLDELPQLLNVVGGSMSLVGPRPAIDYELRHYGPGHYRRFDVCPGITGLWQVSGRNLLGLTEMLDLDAEYASSRTMTTDLVILLRTPVAAIRNAA